MERNKPKPPNKVFFEQSNLSFRFVVTVGHEKIAAFTECTLPAIEWEVQTIKEGGLNDYDHQLPSRRKSGRVTLKNGVGKSILLEWYGEILAHRFSRRKITIELLDQKNQPIVSWAAEGAYPVKWSGPQLKTDSNAVAIQTIEFAYTDFIVESK